MPMRSDLRVYTTSTLRKLDPRFLASGHARPVQPRMSRSGYWFFDERYGDQAAAYVAVDPGHTPDHWPNIPARLTCDVVYERRVWAVFRRVQDRKSTRLNSSHSQISY